VTERGDLRQQLGVDVLAGDQQLCRLDAGCAGSLDEILTLCCEKAELVAPAAVLQLADELQLLVVARGDQALSADLALRRRLATPTREVARAPPAQPSNAPRWNATVTY